MRRQYATLGADGKLHPDQTPSGVSGEHPDQAAHVTLGLATAAQIATAVSDHEAASDPHSAYQTSSDVDAKIEAHEGATDPHPTYETSDEAVAKMLAHEGAADPHPIYLRAAEADLAYQPLDSDLAAIAALSTTSFGRSLLALADAAALADLHSHGGGGSSNVQMAALANNMADVTGTGLVVISGLTLPTQVGIYKAEWALIWQTTATTTGIEFVPDHTGTESRFVATGWTQTTGGAAATGVADQATTATAQMIEGKSSRAAGTRTGVLQGVDTANVDQLTIFHAVIVVTGAGNITMSVAAEAAGLVVRVMAGSSLILTKIA